MPKLPTATPGLGAMALSMGKKAEEKSALGLDTVVRGGLAAGGALLRGGQAALTAARPVAAAVTTAAKPLMQSATSLGQRTLSAGPVQTLRTAGKVVGGAMVAGRVGQNALNNGQSGKQVLSQDNLVHDFIRQNVEYALGLPLADPDAALALRLKFAQEAIHPASPHDLGASLFHTVRRR